MPNKKTKPVPEKAEEDKTTPTAPGFGRIDNPMPPLPSPTKKEA
jgi:hypothetical protein